MSKNSTRILLLVLFIVLSYFIWLRDTTSVIPSIRKSRWSERSQAEVIPSHIGKLSDYRLPEKKLFTDNSFLSYLGFDKKINTYYFTFYNWYHFEISFVDLGYESFIEFKTFSEDHLSDRWVERVGFSLDDAFYPKGGNIKLPNKGVNCTKCGCCGQKGLNFDVTSSIFNISVRQNTQKNLSDSRHDGYKYSRFWYYTPNKSLDDPSNEPFKGDITVTEFNITYKG